MLILYIHEPSFPTAKTNTINFFPCEIDFTISVIANDIGRNENIITLQIELFYQSGDLYSNATIGIKPEDWIMALSIACWRKKTFWLRGHTKKSCSTQLNRIFFLLIGMNIFFITSGPDHTNFNPFLPSGLFHPYQMNESICQLRGGCFSLFSSFFIFRRNTHLFYTNNADPDQMPRSFP